AVVVKDVDVVEPHALQALIQAGEQILARAEVSIRSGPHIPAGFRRDDEFVAVRLKIFLEDLTEVFFRRAVRRAVVVGEIEMRDAEIEGAAQHGPAVFEIIHSTEVVPKSERNGRQFDAAAAAAAISHGVVTMAVGNVHDRSPGAPEGATSAA